jgi:excisionase family DNA binding protein
MLETQNTIPERLDPPWKFWTRGEIEKLRKMREGHYSADEIAVELGRTRHAVLAKLQRLYPPAPKRRGKAAEAEIAPPPHLGPLPDDLARFLSLEDVAELLRLSKARIKQLISSGELASVKIGKRRLVRMEAYRKFVESL